MPNEKKNIKDVTWADKSKSAQICCNDNGANLLDQAFPPPLDSTKRREVSTENQKNNR